MSGCADLLGEESGSSTAALARLVEAVVDEDALETLDESETPQEAFAELLEVRFEYTHSGASADADSLVAVFQDPEGERQETPLSEFSRRRTVEDGDVVTITGVGLTSGMAIEKAGEVLAERAGVDADWLLADGMPLPIASSEDGAVAFEFSTEGGVEASAEDLTFEEPFDDCYEDFYSEDECDGPATWTIDTASGHVSLDASGTLRIATSAGQSGTTLRFAAEGESGYEVGFEVQGEADGEPIDMAAAMTVTASGEMDLGLEFDGDRELERTTAEGRGEADVQVEQENVPGLEDMEEGFPMEGRFGPETEAFEPGASEVEQSLVRFAEALWDLDLQPGDEYSLEVDLDDGFMDLQASFVSQVVGREERRVDGRPLDTLRVEDRFEILGSLDGSPFEDLAIETTYWLDEESYLPVFAQTEYSRSYSRQEIVDSMEPWLEMSDLSDALPEDASLRFEGTATLRMVQRSGDLRVAGITGLNAVRYATSLAPAMLFLGSDPFATDDAYGVFPPTGDCGPYDSCEPIGDPYETPYQDPETQEPTDPVSIQAGANGPYDVPEDGTLWLQFQLPTGGEVTIETTGESPQDTVIGLLDADYTYLDSDDDGGEDGYSLLQRDLPAGLYYVSLRGYGGQQLSGVTVRLDVDDRSGIEAVPVLVGSSSGPYSAESGEELWFTFSVGIAQTVTISTSGPYGGDTVLTLYDHAFGYISENDDKSMADTYSQLSANLEPGQYYIELAGFDGDPFDDVTLTLA